jgi:alpha-tubulin suppressor-like RCC1 family protein
MSCGSSNHGVLGHDSFDQNDKKKKVKKLEFVVKTEEIGYIVSISCGSNHNLVLTSKGEVFGWGSNEFFQIMPTLNENHGESR